MRRVESEPNLALANLATPLASVIANPVTALADDADERFGHALPNDHPQWMRDALAISARARALVAKLEPIVIRVRAAFEHVTRSVAIGNRDLRVDASGSYRFD